MASWEDLSEYREWRKRINNGIVDLFDDEDYKMMALAFGSEEHAKQFSAFFPRDVRNDAIWNSELHALSPDRWKLELDWRLVKKMLNIIDAKFQARKGVRLTLEDLLVKARKYDSEIGSNEYFGTDESLENIIEDIVLAKYEKKRFATPKRHASTDKKVSKKVSSELKLMEQLLK